MRNFKHRPPCLARTIDQAGSRFISLSGLQAVQMNGRWVSVSDPVELNRVSYAVIGVLFEISGFLTWNCLHDAVGSEGVVRIPFCEAVDRLAQAGFSRSKRVILEDDLLDRFPHTFVACSTEVRQFPPVFGPATEVIPSTHGLLYAPAEGRDPTRWMVIPHHRRFGASSYAGHPSHPDFGRPRHDDETEWVMVGFAKENDAMLARLMVTKVVNGWSLL